MATKAEVQAAVEAIGIAVANAAKVAAALTESVTPNNPIPQTADVVITDRGNGTLLVTTRPGIDKVWWTVAQNVAPGYPWYTDALKQEAVPAGGLTLKPAYYKDGDFVKVGWGSTFETATWIDGPKTTKANTTTPTTTTTGTAGGKVIANWRMGVNLERFRPGHMAWQGSKLTLPPYFTQYLPSIGVNWVRYFIPFGSENDMGAGVSVTPAVGTFGDIIESARVASQNKMGVAFGMTDVIEAWSLDSRWDAVQQNVRNVARAVKDKLDPNYVVLEIANEMGGGDNAYFNAKRIRLHEIIRAECPQHTIVHGCANWNSGQWGSDWQTPPDGNVVLQYHRYSRDTWSDVRQCQQVATRLGTQMYGGEVMPEFGNGSYNDWGQTWMDCLANGGHACAGWAVTDGRDFQMSRGGNDATLRPELEAWTKRVAATYK